MFKRKWLASTTSLLCLFRPFSNPKIRLFKACQEKHGHQIQPLRSQMLMLHSFVFSLPLIYFFLSTNGNFEVNRLCWVYSNSLNANWGTWHDRDSYFSMCNLLTFSIFHPLDGLALLHTFLNHPKINRDRCDIFFYFLEIFVLHWKATIYWLLLP